MGRYRYATRQPRGRIVTPFAVPPFVAPPIPQFLSARRQPLRLVSRGRVGTAPIQVERRPPSVVSSRRRGLFSRRTGRVFQPPFPPVRVAPPVLPQFLSHRRPSLLRWRHSTVTQFTYPGAAPQFLIVFPQFVGHHQPRMLKMRRSVIQQFAFPGAPPVILPPIPSYTYRRRAPLMRLRRSILLSPIAAPLNIGHGPVVPNMLRRHRWLMRRWAGETFAPFMVGAPPPPVPPINPVPPNFSGGLSGLSLGKRMHRNKNRPIKSSYDKTLVFRQLWGDD